MYNKLDQRQFRKQLACGQLSKRKKINNTYVYLPFQNTNIIENKENTTMSKDLTQLIVAVAEAELLAEHSRTLFPPEALPSPQGVLALLDPDAKGYTTLLNIFDFIRLHSETPTEHQVYVLFQMLDTQVKGCLDVESIAKLFGLKISQQEQQITQLAANSTIKDKKSTVEGHKAPNDYAEMLVTYFNDMIRALRRIDDCRMTLMNIDKGILFDLIDVEKQEKVTIDSMDKFVKKNKPNTDKDIRKGISLYFKKHKSFELDFDGFLQLALPPLIQIPNKPASVPAEVLATQQYSEIDHLLAQKMKENQQYKKQLMIFQKKRQEVLASINTNMASPKAASSSPEDPKKSIKLDDEKLRLEERLKRIREKWNLDENLDRDVYKINHIYKQKELFKSPSTANYKHLQAKANTLNDDIIEQRIAQLGSKAHPSRAKPGNTQASIRSPKEKSPVVGFIRNSSARKNKIPEDLLAKYGGNKGSSILNEVTSEEYFDSELGRKIQKVICHPKGKLNLTYQISASPRNDPFSITSPDKLAASYRNSKNIDCTVSDFSSMGYAIRDRVGSPTFKCEASHKYTNSGASDIGLIYSPRKLLGSNNILNTASAKTLGISVSTSGLGNNKYSYTQDLNRMRCEVDREININGRYY